MLSRIAYFVSLLVLCYSSFFFYPKWNKQGVEATISWDVSGYYWYLPAIFIYKDVKKLSFKDSIIAKYAPTGTELQQAMPLDNGNFVMKYSSGMAVMYLPFFAVAHVLAAPLGYPADGFSYPYQLAIQFGGLLVSLLGLWLLRRLLLLYYADRVVAITLFLIACGTNYLNYAAVDSGMSHTWLFTIYVLLLLSTHYLFSTFRVGYALVIGFLVGLATLTRPTEIISCLIPLLWGLDGFTRQAFTRYRALLVQHARLLLVSVVTASAVVFIQFAYWKYVSGHWFVYSYGEQGFSWFHPHWYVYSFNYRTGWLTYCPMMLLALAGFLLYVRNGKHKVAVIAFFLVSFYCVTAWDIWWYGGRAMVQSYALMSLPFAAIVQWTISRRAMTWIFAAAAAVFCYLNIWIFVQYHGGGLYDGECMSRAYYWRVLGRWSAPDDTRKLLDAADLFEGTPVSKTLLFEQRFDTCIGLEYVETGEPGNKALLLNSVVSRTPAYKVPYSSKGPGWVRLQASFLSKDREENIWKMPTMSVRLDNGETYVKENFVRIGRFIKNGIRSTVFVDIKLPKQPYTHLTFVVWNQQTNKEIIVDDVQAWDIKE